ncbi:hypothetical protein [Seongchinamella sediminis]|uniref:hypothetical protein n=1 Tax=Seongchinamella sediminis TaxID=2283635 RepID=UPI0019676CF7|nr:hypothetical protein [Seongchinamella sediminis]
MSSPNEKLEPTPFEPATPAEPAPAASASSPNWVLPALAALAALAVLVVFWLPQQVAETGPAAEAPAAATPPPGSPVASKPASEPAGPEVSPWSDAQAAKLRQEAQAVLQELLDLQFSLEERGAPEWAGEAYPAALATAQAGDELYRQRQYVDAKTRYQQALAQLQAINDSIPAVVEAQLALVRSGLEESAVEQVQSALQRVALIEPDNPALAELEPRAAVMQPLLEHLNQAAESEAAGDLEAAVGHLEQAVALDSEHQRAAAALARVSQASLERQFNDAMSKGYSALDEGRYSDASKAFERAADLRPGSAEASSALQEVAVAQQASRLTTLKRRGRELEQSEQWQQAVDTYQSALDTDSSLLFAVEGLERSEFRARLDKQFRAAILQPERLSDVAVAEATGKLLQQAKTISPRGPVLEEQISTLDLLLQQANTTVPVTLRSDGETEVIIYKVARLGKFEQQQLTLRPGTYRVRGSRVGYRDVLHEFTVSHRGDVPPIDVRCTEQIL